jgi:hypothetical protein
MDINAGAQQDSCYPPASRFNEKGCLQVCGGVDFTIYRNIKYIIWDVNTSVEFTSEGRKDGGI